MSQQLGGLAAFEQGLGSVSNINRAALNHCDYCSGGSDALFLTSWT